MIGFILSHVVKFGVKNLTFVSGEKVVRQNFYVFCTG